MKGTQTGWVPQKKDDWPHLWIQPADSFTITVKAAEVTVTTDFRWVSLSLSEP